MKREREKERERERKKNVIEKIDLVYSYIYINTWLQSFKDYLISRDLTNIYVINV
jgi:hypothetical protein